MSTNPGLSLERKRRSKMDIEHLIPLVEKIRGCTFASLDGLTQPKPGVFHRVTGDQVIIFRTSGVSGFENMVKRRLKEAGKNPDSFHVGPLPWGERVADLPIIKCKDKYYLQTILLALGKSEFFIMPGIEVQPEHYGIKPRKPPTEEVQMHTYNIDNITRIRLMGETLVDNDIAENGGRRFILSK